LGEDQVTITLPMSAHGLGVLITVLAAALLSLVVFWMTGKGERKDWFTAIREKMGLTGLHPVVVIFLSLAWAALFLILLTGIFWVLFAIGDKVSAVSEAEGLDLRWYLLTLTAVTAALGAVISLPFTLIKTTLNRRQTETSEQGLITDRINKAVEGLGAEKVVKRQRIRKTSGKLAYGKDDNGKTDLSKPIMEEVTLPNLEVRIGAIFALRRIAKDSSEDRHDILDMLCAYVRENAPVDGAIKSPHEVHKELSEGRDQSPPLNDHDIFKHSDYQSANTIGIDPTELNEETLMDWSRKLPPARMDIQMAVDVIGGIRQTFPETAGQHRIDLSLANLQNLRLDGTFSNTNFDSARLDNAELSGEFCNSTFIKTSLQKAHSRASNFIDCDFSDANLYGSFFGACDCS
jgi:hypothetical protein